MDGDIERSKGLVEIKIEPSDDLLPTDAGGIGSLARSRRYWFVYSSTKYTKVKALVIDLGLKFFRVEDINGKLKLLVKMRLLASN